MRKFSFLGLALALASAQLAAQTLYRCGNEYRDTPCPNAIALDARDPRTPAQSAQAQRQTAKDAALAQQMETLRLQAEAVAAKRLQAQAQREVAQEKKRSAEAKVLERAQEPIVLKPNKKQREDVFTVRSPKPPKNAASAAPPPKSP
jgi:hypothetical protein